MTKKCINYVFCKGTIIKELEIPTCLLCGKWYEHGEKWGELEFIETDEDCPVCYAKGLQMKFPTNCGHSFCIQCCRNLLIYQEELYCICPTKFGCPPCKHYIENIINSCKNRPCCDEDQNILDNWEKEDYESFIKWNYFEFNISNEDHNYLLTKKCPLCRAIYR
jgi:hypothetical protein